MSEIIAYTPQLPISRNFPDGVLDTYGLSFREEPKFSPACEMAEISPVVFPAAAPGPSGFRTGYGYRHVACGIIPNDRNI